MVLTQALQSVRWHDLECGGYRADLPTWLAMAEAADGAIADVGAGTGRVSLHLARAGHRMIAVDIDEDLLGALRSRAEGLPVDEVLGDARELALPAGGLSLILVPMQTIQLLGGAGGRARFLERAAAHLAPGGLLACAIVGEVDRFDTARGDEGPGPEIMWADGAVYVSRAVRVSVSSSVIRIERERRIIAAGGEETTARERNVIDLDRVSARQLHREGRDAGLRPVDSVEIGATEEHVASEVVILGGR